jgi:hypothetical protein
MDFHVTLGFNSSDVHSKEKGIPTRFAPVPAPVSAAALFGVLAELKKLLEARFDCLSPNFSADLMSLLSAGAAPASNLQTFVPSSWLHHLIKPRAVLVFGKLLMLQLHVFGGTQLHVFGGTQLHVFGGTQLHVFGGT